MKRLLLTIIILFVFSTSIFAQNVLVNIWDGAEYAKIESLYNQNLLPNLQSIGELKHLTCNTNCFDQCTVTQTKPQHSIMLTGYLADVTENYNNADYQLIAPELTIYEQAININPQLHTAHLVTKPDEIGEILFGNIVTVVNRFFAKDVRQWTVTDKAINSINLWVNNNFLIICHFSQPDKIGHVYGVNSWEYQNQIQRNDVQLGNLVTALQTNGILKETFIIILGDHGFGYPDDFHHYRSPDTFIVGVNEDIYMEDITSIILDELSK